MTKTILITSVGAPPGLNTAKILSQEPDYRIIAVDADQYASGLYLNQIIPYVIPFAREKNYISTLLDICKKEKVDAILPCYEMETIKISAHRHLFEQQGVKLLLSPHQTLMASCDKLQTAQQAVKANIPCPQTHLIETATDINNFNFTFPVVLKPTIGSGARGIVYPKNKQELLESFQTLTKDYGKMIVQELIPGGDGTVYVCALLYDNQHQLKASFVSRSLKAMYKTGGPCIVGEPVKNETIRQLGIKLLNSFGNFTGPAAIEFKMDPRDNTPKLMEINPRLWGYSHLAFGSGINFHKMTAQLTLREDIPEAHDYDTNKILVRSHDDQIYNKEEALNRLTKINSFSLTESNNLPKKTIDKITAYNLKIPITETYHLSFGDIDFFETTLVVIESGGKKQIGEATPLPGYSWETNDSVWKFIKEICPQLLNKNLDEVIKFTKQNKGKNNFAATAIITPLELLQFPNLFPIKHQEIPLVGIISSNNLEEIKTKLQQQLNQGFQIIKVKVGSSQQTIEDDVKKIQFIHSFAPHIKLRVDANKAYNFEQAKQFLECVQNCNIEEFEQPFPIENWEDQRKLYQIRGNVPLMLDESINTGVDLDKALEVPCCDFIKFKLMKHSSIVDTLALAKKAQEHGIKVIIGNGVAGEISCLHETFIASCLPEKYAGEMNGFLKQRTSLLKYLLSFKQGNILINQFQPELNKNKIQKFLVDSFEISS